MKSWLVTLWVVIGLGCFAVYAKEDTLIPDSLRDEFYAVDTLAAAFQAATKNETIIWPGYRPTENPLLLGFESGHLYMIFQDSAPAGWQQSFGFQSRMKIAYTQTDPIGVTDGWLAPSVMFGNKDYGFSMVSQQYLESRDFQGMVEAIVAEQFLNYLDKQGISAADPFHFEPRVRASRLAMMAMGQEEMRSYLESKNSNHLINYVALLTERKRVTNADEFKRESLLAIRKGLPKYVSFKVAAQFFPALKFRALIAKQLNQTTAETDIISWAYNDRYEGIGSALAVALDDLKVDDWKNRVGKESLQDMLMKALGVSDEKVRDRVAALVNDSDYRQRISDTEDLITNYEQQLALLEHDFLKEPGFHVLLEAQSFPISFQGVNKQSYILLDSGNVIQFGAHGLVFDQGHHIQGLFKDADLMSTTAGQWHFVANDGFKLVADDSDPITVTMGEWTRKFNHLTWTASTSVMKITTPGRIEAKDGQLHILLAPPIVRKK
ncbi:MAG: hypothetical protein V4490_05740 [Pseudomonadota bacterium]